MAYRGTRCKIIPTEHNKARLITTKCPQLAKIANQYQVAVSPCKIKDLALFLMVLMLSFPGPQCHQNHQMHPQ